MNDLCTEEQGMAVGAVDLARRKLCPSKGVISTYCCTGKFRVVGKLMKRRSVDVHINASGRLGWFIEDRMLSIQALRRSGYSSKFSKQIFCATTDSKVQNI